MHCPATQVPWAPHSTPAHASTSHPSPLSSSASSVPISFCNASASRSTNCRRRSIVVDPNESHRPLLADAGQYALDRFDKLRHASGDTPTSELRLRMQNVMQNNCAVFRTQDVMDEGVAKMKEVTDGVASIRVSDRSMIWNSDLVETLEFENLVEQAAVTMSSAANRQESRGAHARDDIPDRDDENWMKHTIAWIDEDYNVKIDYRPVHMETLTNEIQPVPPKARVY